MPVDKERTCTGLVLVWIDLFQLILGLAILGFSIYVLVAAKSAASISFIPATSYIGLGVGAALVLASCLGCYISQRNASPALRVLYLLLTLGALAAVIAGAVLISQYIGALNLQGTISSASLQSAFDVGANNFILSIYTACCTGCGGLALCDSSMVQPFYAGTQANCLTLGVPSCANAHKCNGVIQSGCYVGADVTVPAFTIDQGTCDLFTSAGLVGSRSDSKCGNGLPVQFLNETGDWLSSYFTYVLIAFSVFAGLLGCAVFCTIVLLCCEAQKNKR